jgi:hypothetical protein
VCDTAGYIRALFIYDPEPMETLTVALTQNTTPSVNLLQGLQREFLEQAYNSQISMAVRRGQVGVTREPAVYINTVAEHREYSGEDAIKLAALIAQHWALVGGDEPYQGDQDGRIRGGFIRLQGGLN